MQLKPVLLGIILATLGVLAYSTIPNTHRTPTLITQAIIPEQKIDLFVNETRILSRTLAINQGTRVNLKVNISITDQQGGLSAVKFQVFPRNDSASCITTQPSGYLVNQSVSNNSFSLAVGKAATYCFLLDNDGSQTEKSAHLSAFLDTRYEQVRASNDGVANTAGLGVGAIGLIVLVYGLARKTVIPWE